MSATSQTGREEIQDIRIVIAHENFCHAWTIDRIPPVTILTVKSHATAAIRENIDDGEVGSLYQRVRTASGPVYAITIVGLVLLSLALGFAALYLTPPGGSAAIWWPAAGVSVLLYLLYRGPKWQVILLVATVAALSNLLVGRSVGFALVGIVVLVAEVLVFALILRAEGSAAMLGSTQGFLRFMLASLSAALTVGAMGTVGLMFLANAPPIPTFLSLVPSHLSALLLIAPIALVPLPRRRRGRRMELLAQVIGTAGLTFVIFAPWQADPIASALLPLLGWAAVRFSPIVVTVELTGVAVLGSVLTSLGGGAYVAAGEQGLSTAALLQIYLLAIASTMHFLTSTKNEAASWKAVQARSAAILRGGFVGSQVGAIFIRPLTHEEYEIVEMNDVGAAHTSGDWLPSLVTEWMMSGDREIRRELETAEFRTIQISGQLIDADEGEVVLGLQTVDVTNLVTAERTATEAAVRERAVVDTLRKLAVEKDNFIATVSHELRTPVTNIIGFTEELDDSASDEQRESTAIIMRNALRLSQMVEQLLGANLMTAPNSDRLPTLIDVNEVVTGAIEDQSSAARAKKIEVTLDSTSQPAQVLGTTDAVERIVINLLSNGIKFTPEGGRIQFSTAQRGDAIVLTIDDSGVGISKIDAERVFDRFYRSSDSVKLQTPGTGLGLSITKGLVELLNGTIAVGRSALGGARFEVTLPAAHPPVEPSTSALGG